MADMITFQTNLLDRINRIYDFESFTFILKNPNNPVNPVEKQGDFISYPVCEMVTRTSLHGKT